MVYKTVIIITGLTVIDCGHPGTPENGNTTVTNTTVGSTATHTCDDLYILHGVSQRQCLLNGSWSPDLPSCIRKLTMESKHITSTLNISIIAVIRCDDPGIPQNGNTSRRSSTVGSIVNHTCNVGYNLNGADQRECLPNGNWSESLPVCNSGTGSTMQTTTTFGILCLYTIILLFMQML